MRVTVAAPDFIKIADGSERQAAASQTAAMREETVTTKTDLRDQVTDAGLGTRLANTWRGNTYPDGRDSLDPAGYLWSNAPAIVSAFDAGATILPVGGHRYLWLPTPSVPRTRTGGARGGKKPATPAEVEAIFDQDLTLFKGRRGNLLAFVDAAKTRSRILRRRAPAGKRRLVLMFTLVPVARLRKRLDLAAAVAAFATRWPDTLARHWR